MTLILFEQNIVCVSDCLFSVVCACLGECCEMFRVVNGKGRDSSLLKRTFSQKTALY